jgi:hypothetical protein
MPCIFNGLGVICPFLAKFLSSFMQEIAHFAAEFPSGYRLPAAVEGMAGVQAAGFALATQNARPLTPPRTCSQILLVAASSAR